MTKASKMPDWMTCYPNNGHYKLTAGNAEKLRAVLAKQKFVETHPGVWVKSETCITLEVIEDPK